MFAFLFSRDTLEGAMSNPLFLVVVVFWVWMFVDALRREEWVWAIFIGFFVISAIFYYFLVYRQDRTRVTGGTFELPGTSDRRRIRELEDQIHHMDKAYDHAELGEIYLRQGKRDQARECFEAARERDGEDLDILAMLGKCYLEQGRVEESIALLERVVEEEIRHDYGQTQMTLGEAHAKRGDLDAAIAVWESVLAGNTYAKARVLLGEALLVKGDTAAARAQFQEVVNEGAHTPEFQRRKDRPWVRRARQCLSKKSETS